MHVLAFFSFFPYSPFFHMLLCKTFRELNLSIYWPRSFPLFSFHFSVVLFLWLSAPVSSSFFIKILSLTPLRSSSRFLTSLETFDSPIEISSCKTIESFHLGRGYLLPHLFARSTLFGSAAPSRVFGPSPRRMPFCPGLCRLRLSLRGLIFGRPLPPNVFVCLLSRLVGLKSIVFPALGCRSFHTSFCIGSSGVPFSLKSVLLSLRESRSLAIPEDFRLRASWSGLWS